MTPKEFVKKWRFFFQIDLNIIIKFCIPEGEFEIRSAVTQGHIKHTLSLCILIMHCTQIMYS